MLNMHVVRHLTLGLALMMSYQAISHDATYYTHYTNSAMQLNLTLNPSKAVYWSGAIMDMQTAASGYITGYNTPGYPTTVPINCLIDGQQISIVNAPWSPYGVTPVHSLVPVLGLDVGSHNVTVENTNTWEYMTETVFSSSYTHTSWFTTYHHYYYNVFHRLTVPCSATRTFTVEPSTNFHKIRLGTYHTDTDTVLLEETFDGEAGAVPNTEAFLCAGEVALNGNGQVDLQTWTYNQSSLRSVAGASVQDKVRLQFRALAYAEGTVIYGDGQPRGLRAGTDPNNVLEFYSASGTSIGIRARRNGVETAEVFPLPSGVGEFHDYEIQASETSAVFSLDGAVLGTLTSNIPSEALNFFACTFDGYAGNVPARVDNVRLTAPQPSAPICQITYTGIPTNTYWLYWSWDLANWNLHSSARSSTNGTAIWEDQAAPGQKFYRIFGP